MPPPVKCLIVDDLEENILALSALLQRDDVQLLSARSGAEALEMLLKTDVALAFLDVQMPEMDGFELAELLRGSERTRHIPLIFVTAGAREQTACVQGLRIGSRGFHLQAHRAASSSRTRRMCSSSCIASGSGWRMICRIAARLCGSTEMFTALLAHDLRSPLSAILASSQVLKRRSEDSAALEAAARIESSGRRMAGMIEDMLDLARARLAGGIIVKREPADLRLLVERVVREHQAAVPSRPIEAAFDGDLSGQWDPERIAQVASNLIGNAMKHGDAGGLVSVRLDGTRSDSVSLMVKNAGTIAPEVLAHLFDPFRGGRREAGRGEGLGLGLYIVSQIVQAHQGQVSVKTGDGNETSFLVQLPRTDPR